MPRTVSDLVQRALSILNAYGAGDTGSASGPEAPARSLTDLRQRVLSILNVSGAGSVGPADGPAIPSRTLEDLARESLSILNEVGAGQDGAPEDLDVARAEAPEMLARAFRRDLTADFVTTAVPGELFGPLATMLANAIADKFAVDDATAGRIAERTAVAEKELRALRRGRSAARVDAEIPGLLRAMFRRDLTAEPLTTSIPGDLFTPIANWIANAVADDFAIEGDAASKIATRATAAEAQLRSLRLGRGAARVEREVPGLLQSLFEREVTAFEVYEPIPDAMFTPIAICLANVVADDFAADGETVSKIAARTVAAETELRLLKRGRPDYRPQCSEYF